MKANYLFPSNYKKVGWLILIPTMLTGLFIIFNDYQPSFLYLRVPALYVKGLFDEQSSFTMVSNNIFDELISVLMIISLLLVAFSKEKIEDELISKIRMESLVWATYVNYGILLLSILLIYEMAFFSVMIFNMFTILIIFIIRFNWYKMKLKKAAKYEE